jgi:hypothetical protein
MQVEDKNGPHNGSDMKSGVYAQGRKQRQGWSYKWESGKQEGLQQKKVLLHNSGCYKTEI